MKPFGKHCRQIFQPVIQKLNGQIKISISLMPQVCVVVVVVAVVITVAVVVDFVIVGAVVNEDHHHLLRYVQFVHAHFGFSKVMFPQGFVVL